MEENNYEKKCNGKTDPNYNWYMEIFGRGYCGFMGQYVSCNGLIEKCEYKWEMEKRINSKLGILSTKSPNLSSYKDIDVKQYNKR